MRRPQLRRDRRAYSLWLIIAIIAVIAIVIVAALMVEAGSPNVNDPTADSKYQLSIRYKFEMKNYPAGIWVMPENSREFKVKVDDFDWDSYKSSSNLYFSFKPFGPIHGDDDNKFEFKLKLTITGPDGFHKSDSWKLEYEIGEGNSREVNFGQKLAFVEEDGSYTVEAKLWVDAPAEDIPFTDDLDDALIWTHSKTVRVGTL